MELQHCELWRLEGMFDEFKVFHNRYYDSFFIKVEKGDIPVE